MVQKLFVWPTPKRSTRLSASTPALIICGVPQGSVLCPTIFLLYTAGLLPLTEGHGLRPHFYADDTHIYSFCPPSESQGLQRRISTCIDEVAACLFSNWLQLNTTKTEILWSSTNRRLHQLPQLPLRVGSDQIVPGIVVRDLGNYVSLRSHVAKTAVLFLDPEGSQSATIVVVVIIIVNTQRSYETSHTHS